MSGWIGRRRIGPGAATWSLVAVMVALTSGEASALIRGGEGNGPIGDPGWPAGGSAIFNHPARVAWWEGPPFGGGMWVAECRGDARAFNAVLADFARLDGKNKRIVVQDGVAQSHWLNPNREPARQAAARIDWAFTVWEPARWERLRKLPVSLNPTDPLDAEKGPPASIDVSTGGNLRWSEVIVPAGIEVVDQRLEAHGFTPADGIVLEGKVSDLATKRPLAARIRLERVEPRARGGYSYVVAVGAVADPEGRWVLKKAPAGWHRVVIEADGYVARVVGYGRFDDQPRWSSYEGGLSRPGPVSGRITDEAGQPVGDVEVQFQDRVSIDGGRYETPDETWPRTDVDGRFRSDRIPIGHATIWIHKSGYCRPGLGLPVATPADDLTMSLIRSARVRVEVDFRGVDRPAGYMVQMKPEGGEAVGKWSGSGDIDAANRIGFDDVPPARYVLRGRPNPSSGDRETSPIVVDLKGGQTAEVTLKAR
jgi:hypothetical protein